MNENNERFENFLREFQPRQPRALPTAVKLSSLQWYRFTAAAIIVIACGVSFWVLSKQSAMPPETAASTAQREFSVQFSADDKSRIGTPSTLALTRLAIENPGRFDEELTKLSSTVLPRFDSSASTLRVLAKE